MRASEFKKIAKQIEKVELEDADYIKNPKWQYLRAKQDNAYIWLAKSQIDHHKTILEKYVGEDEKRFAREIEKSREQIKFCEEFLKLFSPDFEKVLKEGENDGRTK
jgi:hypothetical protein